MTTQAAILHSVHSVHSFHGVHADHAAAVSGSVKVLTCAALSLLITCFSAAVMNQSTVTPLTQAAAAQALTPSAAVLAAR